GSARPGHRRARLARRSDPHSQRPVTVARRRGELGEHADHRLAGHTAPAEQLTPDAIRPALDIRSLAGERPWRAGKMASSEKMTELVCEGGGKLIVIQAIEQRLRHLDVAVRPSPGPDLVPW